VVELAEAGPSESFELAHSGSSGDGKRFRLVTDRAAATGTPVAGSFEGEQSKEQCFQLCILEARCKGVFLTTAGECSLVNEIATMETTSVAGLSFLKRSSLPDKYAPDVQGPLGSQTLRERNEAEGKRDQRIMRANALVAHKESRDAQIAWRESDARINERQQSDEARDQLRLAIATGHSNEYAAISKSDLQMRQEKAAALEALVTGRRTAKQTEADTIASTIRKAAEQRKAAVNDWVDSRTELREMRTTGLQMAQQMLHDGVQSARKQREAALTKATEIKQQLKAKALESKQEQLSHLHTEEQLAVSHSFEAKAHVLQEVATESAVNDVMADASEPAETDDSAAEEKDAVHTDLEQHAVQVQQAAAKQAEKTAKAGTSESQAAYVAAMATAVAQATTATEKANADLTADLDMARIEASKSQHDVLEKYEEGTVKAEEEKKIKLELIDTNEKAELVRLKAEHKAIKLQLQTTFDGETERLKAAHDQRVKEAEEAKKQSVEPLYNRFNSQKAAAAREKAQSYTRVAQHESGALDDMPDLPVTPLPAPAEELASEIAEKQKEENEAAKTADEANTQQEEVPAVTEDAAEVPAAADDAAEVPAAAEDSAEVPAAAEDAGVGEPATNNAEVEQLSA